MTQLRQLFRNTGLIQDAGHGLASAFTLFTSTGHAPARHVVKNEDAGRPRRRFQKTLGLRIVDALDLVVVIEIAHRAAVFDQLEALAIEGYFTDDRPRIADRNLDFHIANVRPRLVRRRFVV